MFRYFEYQRTVVDREIKEFVSDGSVDVYTFSFGNGSRFIVSVSGDQSSIDAVVAAQGPDIALAELSLDAFKAVVSGSDQVKRIYSIGGEFLDRELKVINARYPKAEQGTWPIQVEEAKAFSASGDPADATILKYLAEQEGDTVENFVSSVLIKAQEFKLLVANALSKKRLQEQEMLAKVGYL